MLMNAPDKSSMVERSTTVRFLRWLCTWRAVRRILIGLAWLVALIALFHGEENWRGRRAWNQCRREIEARGEPLDYRALIPKPVPDEQNFAATPAIKSWFETKTAGEGEPSWGDEYAQVGDRVHPPKAKDARASRHLEDLAGWEAAFAAVRSGEVAGHKEFYSAKLDPQSRAQAAPAVLEGLRTNEALFAELRLASGRPKSRYPVNYEIENIWAIRLPHLRRIKGACQRLQLKACAELASGQSEKALEDLKLQFYLADSLRTDPFLISYLVRLACVQLAVQPIWEGLAEHRWSEAQLQELETRFQQYNFIVDMKSSFNEERAAALWTVEMIRQKGPWYLNAIGSPDSTPPPRESMSGKFLGAVLIPQGWYYQEELNYCRGFNAELATGLDITKNQISPTQVKADVQAFERMMAATGFAWAVWEGVLGHKIMARMLLPALNKVMLKSAAAQTAVNQAAIACALERYRRANGHFPEKLDALVPQFISKIPNDLLTGGPYTYRRTDDGRFVLYSVGWDEKDDGGVAGKTLFDEKQGDWVWEYPAK
jgi:hypothetical protein